MTTTEKLTAIRAKCVEIIELGKKRTPERWRLAGGCVKAGSATVANPPRMTDTLPSGGIDDAAFIAACAGPAEKAARTVMEEIDELLPVLKGETTDATLDFMQYAMHRAPKIIAAWEGVV